MLSEQGFAYLGLLVYYDLVKTEPGDERFDVSTTTQHTALLMTFLCSLCIVFAVLEH
jgi:hypothetical protein